MNKILFAVACTLISLGVLQANWEIKNNLNKTVYTAYYVGSKKNAQFNSGSLAPNQTLSAFDIYVGRSLCIYFDHYLSTSVITIYQDVTSGKYLAEYINVLSATNTVINTTIELSSLDNTSHHVLSLDNVNGQPTITTHSN